MNSIEKVDPTPEDIQALLADAPPGEFVMLNLLRYKPDGGRERYQEYAEKTIPFLAGVGGEALWFGDCMPAVIAPAAHQWDSVLLVRYPSIQKFMEMVANPEYLEVTKIRTAALDAAVLQPTVARPAG